MNNNNSNHDNNTVAALKAIGEVFAAGYYENENAGNFQRCVRGLIRSLESVPVAQYQPGWKLYPAGEFNLWNPGNEAAVYFHYAFGLEVDSARLRRKAAEVHGENSFRWRLVDQAATELAFLRESDIPPQFGLGGRAYTHGVIHYERLLREGLTGILARVERLHDRNPEFYGALRELLEAMCAYVRRCAATIRPDAPPELIAALEQVPLHPARNFYEAILAYNFFWYFDSCDSGGRVDAELAPYAGDGTPEAEQQALFQEFWHNFDLNNGWHVILDSAQKTCIPAIRAQRPYRRPNSGILIDENTPDEVWEAIFDNWNAGNPSPSLYARNNYRRELECATGIGGDDAERFCFGGCTELMIQGKSNTKSIEAGIHLLRILEDTGLDYPDYETFYTVFLRNIQTQIDLMTEGVRRNHEASALYLPQPIRTLFVDDCIERGLDFEAGGARYNTSVINVVGLTDTVNSLYAIRAAFRGELSVSVAELAAALANDFKGAEMLRRELLALPKYGNDIPEVDLPGREFTRQISEKIRNAGLPGRPFLPAVILFVTYELLGRAVGATADGRRAGAALTDSFGATQGSDLAGPTALIKSASALNPAEFPGTPVLNVRLNRELLATAEARKRLKALLMGYFRMGGLQVQVTVANEEILRRACEEPEKYPELIVRIGGYSEYFKNLSPELRREVARRTIHNF